MKTFPYLISLVSITFTLAYTHSVFSESEYNTMDPKELVKELNKYSLDELPMSAKCWMEPHSSKYNTYGYVMFI